LDDGAPPFDLAGHLHALANQGHFDLFVRESGRADSEQASLPLEAQLQAAKAACAAFSL